jgi:hypothetical protein
MQPTPAPSTYATQQTQAVTPTAAEQKPSLQAPQSTTTNRPNDAATPSGVSPEPGSDTKSTDPYSVKKDGSTYFEAPQLFQKDRTAQRGSIAPVRTALYQQPVTYHQTSAVSAAPVSNAKALQDAAGWTSASK